MKPAGFDLIENIIIPPSPPGTFKVFAVIWVGCPDDFGVLKTFLNRSAAEKYLARLEEYPEIPAGKGRVAWRENHPAGKAMADCCSGAYFYIEPLNVVG